VNLRAVRMASEAGGPARLAAIGSPSAGHEGFTSPAPLACGLRLGNFADRRGTVVVLHLSTRGIRDGRNVPRHRKFSCSQNEPKRENRDNCVSVLADAHKFCNELTPCYTDLSAVEKRRRSSLQDSLLKFSAPHFRRVAKLRRVCPASMPKLGNSLAKLSSPSRIIIR
jgi:hypothetical protein